ncbi:hypothetical protein C8R44DRAFT_744976 [Mycena epipterygia]|nr:hypothetical protein C8R44DRAFT_744976 [Mycena epipterygia]
MNSQMMNSQSYVLARKAGRGRLNLGMHEVGFLDIGDGVSVPEINIIGSSKYSLIASCRARVISTVLERRKKRTQSMCLDLYLCSTIERWVHKIPRAKLFAPIRWWLGLGIATARWLWLIASRTTAAHEYSTQSEFKSRLIEYATLEESVRYQGWMRLAASDMKCIPTASEKRVWVNMDKYHLKTRDNLFVGRDCTGTHGENNDNTYSMNFNQQWDPAAAATASASAGIGISDLDNLVMENV